MNIEIVWKNIKLHEGENFYTITGISFQYIVYNDFLLIENKESRKITKSSIAKAMMIESLTPKKIELAGCWGHSYIYGILTDKRVKCF